MNWKRVSAIARKEFVQIRRDPRSLALGLAVPVLLLILFGYALTLDVDNVPTIIWDRDNSQVAKDFILNFRNSRYFQIIGYTNNYADILRRIDAGDAMIGMILPKDFSRYIESSREAPVQFLIDGSDSNTATIARGYISSVVSRYNSALRERVMRAAASAMNSDPVSFRPRPWFNPNFESRIYIVPGLVAIIMMTIAALLTTLTVAREWERGTMEQLISTPVRPGELIIGKFIPYFGIGFFDLILSIVMARFIFNVPVAGSVVLLIVLSCIFMAGALATGILISVVAKNQRLASQFAILLTFMPTLMLSGFAYPIWNMPDAVQTITYLVQARYYITILRGIYLKGIGIKDLWPHGLLLTLYGGLMIVQAARKFKKKIA